MVQVRGSNAEGSVPTRAARECRSCGGRGSESAAGGRLVVGIAIIGHLVAAPGLRRSTLLRLPACGVLPTRVQVRISKTYGWHPTLIHRHSRHFRVAAQRPMLNLIRLFVCLISTDAARNGVSAAEPVQAARSRSDLRAQLGREKIGSARTGRAHGDSSGWVGKVLR